MHIINQEIEFFNTKIKIFFNRKKLHAKKLKKKKEKRNSSFNHWRDNYIDRRDQDCSQSVGSEGPLVVAEHIHCIEDLA